jgi:hypothetical protein
MQVCLVYFEASEAPVSARRYLHSLEPDSVEIPGSTCWLVAYKAGAAQLYFDLRRHIALGEGFLVVPLERRLVPLHAQLRGLEDFEPHIWLERKYNELKSQP